MQNTKPALTGERREVTILFLDIMNFTATSNQIENEEIFLFIDRVLKKLVEIVHQFDGVVDKFTGDGLMALFGAPVAHENDAERAVRAALEMQEALKSVQQAFFQQHGIDCRARIGIHTGNSIAGQLGNQTHSEYTVIGSAVNLASRLETAAEPGAILVSQATYQRTRPFIHYQAAPTLALKGFADPVSAYQALTVRHQPGRIRGFTGLEVPMIGRQEALHAMLKAAQRTLGQSRSQIVLISGDAGVGKSRLVSEFAQNIDREQMQCFQGGCLTYARSRPMWVVTEVIRDIVGIVQTDTESIQQEQLQTYLESRGLATAGIGPYIAHLLSIRNPDSVMHTRLALLDSTILQQQTQLALRQLFLTEAAYKPTVLVFEDLHWSDTASQIFLGNLIQTIDTAPLLIVLVSRQLERETTIRSIISAARMHEEIFTDIQIQPLGQAEVMELLDCLLGHESTKPTVKANHSLDHFKLEIARRAGGVPFYAEEIVRMLMDQKAFVKTPVGLEIADNAKTILDEVPGTVSGLILTRFDHLQPSLRLTLQKAAVIGQSFPESLLQQLDHGSLAEISQNLSILERQQFLIRRPFGSRSGYMFAHDLILSTIYTTLLNRDRQRLHEEIAQIIEADTEWPTDQRVQVLAHHYSVGSNHDKAVRFLIASGEIARRRGAHESAVGYYNQAQARLPLCHDPAPTPQLDIWLGLGQSQKFLGEFDSAGTTLSQIIDFFKQQNPDLPERLTWEVDALRELADVRLREGALDEAVTHLLSAQRRLGVSAPDNQPLLQISLLDRLAWIHFRQGKLDQAEAEVAKAIQNLLHLGDEASIILANLYNTIAGICWQQGDLGIATENVQKCLALYEQRDYPWGMAIAHTNLGVLYCSQGIWTRAAESFEQALVIRRKNGYLPEQALNLQNLGILHINMGEYRQAHAYLKESLAISHQLGDDFAVVLAELELTKLFIFQKDYDIAIDHLQVANSLLHATGQDQAIQAIWLRALVEAETGDLLRGLESAAQALALAQSSGLTDAVAECSKVLGMLQGRHGEWEKAEQLLQTASTLYQRVNNPYGQAQVLYELGALYERLANALPDQTAHFEVNALTHYAQAVKHFTDLRAKVSLDAAHQGFMRMQDMVYPNMPEGEWYTATVVAFHLMAPLNLDEEILFDARSRLNHILMVTANQHNGRSIRQIEGGLIYFGIPAVCKDDPETAVQTAQIVVRDFQDAVTELDAELRLGVGVTSGNLVARPRNTTQRTGGNIVMGPPLHQAQLLAKTAAPDQIWVAHSVAAVTQNLCEYALVVNHPELQEMGSICTVRKFIARSQDAERLFDHRISQIGRSNQLGALQESSAQLAEGQGGIIWVRGEAGIGKSRLLQEWTKSVQAQPVRIWRAQCTQRKMLTAYSPVTDLLHLLLGLEYMDTPQRVHQKLTAMLAQWPSEVMEIQPFLEIVLGLPMSQQEILADMQLGSDKPQRQLFASIRSLILSLAHRIPLIILVEDIQWIDPVSAELLLFISDIVTLAPVLFVFSCRTGDAVDVSQESIGKLNQLYPSHTLFLDLDPLSTADSRQLIDALLLENNQMADLKQLILDQSRGNPCFIIEYVRMLVEEGHLHWQDQNWAVGGFGQRWQLAAPLTLQMLIRSRFDTLRRPVRQVLQYASVIGAAFSEKVLTNILPTAQVQEALKVLADRRILIPTTQEDSWEFSHPLIESVAYHTLLTQQSRLIHLQVANVLESHWTGAADPLVTELAYHYSQAAVHDKALHFLLLAAEQTASQFAHAESVDLFKKALDLLPKLPQAELHTRWRLYTGLGDVYLKSGEFSLATRSLLTEAEMAEDVALTLHQRAGLYRRLGQSAEKQGNFAEAHLFYQQAQKLVRDSADPEDRREMARTLCWAAWAYFLQGDLDSALLSCQEIQSRYHDSQANGEQAFVENILGGLFYRKGDLTQALHHTQTAMHLREESGHVWEVAASRGNLGVLSILAGNWNEAKSHLHASLALRQDLGDVEGIAIVYHNLGLLAKDQGDIELATQYFQKSLTTAEEHGLGYHAVNAQHGLAWMHIQRGQFEAAQSLLTESLSQAKALNALGQLADNHRISAEMHLQQEQWQRAQQLAVQSAAVDSKAGIRSQEAVAWRIYALAALALHDRTDAWEAAMRAKAVLADVRDPIEEGRWNALMGRISLNGQQWREGVDYLHKAQTIFTQLQAKVDLAEVHSLQHTISADLVQLQR